MFDLLGIFMLLLSLKFMFSRNSILVSSIMQMLLPVEANSQASFSPATS